MLRLLAVFVALLVAAPASAQGVEARHGMVVAQEARAARIGMEILKRGGNAVDAAVATGFAMAVTYPRAGNIGGGGYMVVHMRDRRGRTRQVAIDYRETAPAAATRTMFLDKDGNADPQLSRSSALGIGVPGTVAGLALAHRNYGSGRFSLRALIEPAIKLAREGFEVDADLADSLPRARARMARWPASAKIFLKNDGKDALGAGDTLVQSDLADTLEAIARRGPRAFYHGPIAERIAAAVRAEGGIMTAADLHSYRPLIRQPVRGSYRGHQILSMPPSSSGGVVLIEMLNILEGFDLAKQDEPARLHLMIEAMRRAYADRAVFLGDPATVRAPLAQLMSKDYAAGLRQTIDPARATPSSEIRPESELAPEGQNTTHYSVVDRYGNAVSNTYTLNFSYGVGLVAEGTGVLLNNELDDFAAKPMAPNAYGLIGGDANAPGPRKRPLSSMTPTIVLKDGRPVIVTGSPGGSRIITTVLQVLVNLIDLKLDAAAAVGAPRIHHQWSPDQVIVENALAPGTIAGLLSRGHKVISRGPATAANTIVVTPRGLVGAADQRTRGALAAGY